MSNERQDGWWMASDGNFYPPASPAPPGGALGPTEGWAAPGPYAAPPQAGSWPAPQPFAMAPAQGAPGLAIAALVLGIGSLLFALIPVLGFLSVPFAIGGLVLGIVGISRAAKGQGGKGLSIAGIVTSILALLVSVVYVIVFVAVGSSSDEINSDPADGVCNSERFLQDPDC